MTEKSERLSEHVTACREALKVGRRMPAYLGPETPAEIWAKLTPTMQRALLVAVRNEHTGHALVRRGLAIPQYFRETTHYGRVIRGFEFIQTTLGRTVAEYGFTQRLKF